MEVTEIRRYATLFYMNLFKTEFVKDPGLDSAFLADLPKVGKSSNDSLSAELTLEDLHVAFRTLANGKAPGHQWDPCGILCNFFSIFTESNKRGLLPQSCRRAVITLLPKKGELQEIKNWRPFSLFCTDYKVLSKTLAIRLREVMAEVVHPNQTYCVLTG